MKTYLIIVLILSSSCASIDQLYQRVKTVEAPNPYDKLRFDENLTPVSSELSNVDYIQKFKKIACTKLTEEECIVKYKEVFIARLKLRYKQATSENVEETCEAYPVECNSNNFVEKLYVLSNNFNVGVLEQEEKDRIQAENDQRTKNFVIGFGTAIAKQQEREIANMEKEQERNFLREQINSSKRISCTTNNWGNSIQTNCQ